MTSLSVFIGITTSSSNAPYKCKNLYRLCHSFPFLLLMLLCRHMCTGRTLDEIKGDENKRDEIIGTLFKNYKKHERPTELLRSASNVTVNVQILSINKIDVKNMEYTIDAYLRQEWTDQRLAWERIPRFAAYNSSIVAAEFKNMLWLPDLFFRNGKEGYLHEMTTKNYLMRVRANGQVLYSQKITMRFSCQMDLTAFPMDTQECAMNIGSYGYTVDQLKFNWRTKDPVYFDARTPLQISEFNTPKVITAKDCTMGYSTSTGNYSCLEASFFLKREVGSYLFTTYIPSILIVMVSWLNFWLSIEAVPARVTLGLLSLLAILTQSSSMASSLPRVSYIKAIDIWTIACIIFVVGTLVEYAIATTLARKEKKEAVQEDVKKIVKEELSQWCRSRQASAIWETGKTLSKQAVLERDFCEELETLLTEHAIENKSIKSRQHAIAASEVDCKSRMIFPICFILYNCLYWFYYVVLADYLMEMNHHNT